MIRRVSVFVRAAHLLAVAAVGGAYLLGLESSRLHGWWIAAAGTGVVLLGTEFLQHRHLHREVCGGATLLKLVLLSVVFARPSLGPLAMGAAIVVAAVFAHAPKAWRHQRLF